MVQVDIVGNTTVPGHTYKSSLLLGAVDKTAVWGLYCMCHGLSSIVLLRLCACAVCGSLLPYINPKLQQKGSKRLVSQVWAARLRLEVAALPLADLFGGGVYVTVTISHSININRVNSKRNVEVLRGACSRVAMILSLAACSYGGRDYLSSVIVNHDVEHDGDDDRHVRTRRQRRRRGC